MQFCLFRFIKISLRMWRLHFHNRSYKARIPCVKIIDFEEIFTNILYLYTRALTTVAPSEEEQKRNIGRQTHNTQVGSVSADRKTILTIY